MNREKLFKEIITEYFDGEMVSVCELSEDKIAIVRKNSVAFLPSEDNLLDPIKFRKEFSKNFLSALDHLSTTDQIANFTGNIKLSGKVPAHEFKSADMCCYVNPKLLEVFGYGKKGFNAELYISGLHNPIKVVENGEVVGVVLPMGVQEDT